MGYPKLATSIVALATSSILGFYFIIVLIKWFLKTNYKGFKIALIKTEN